MNRSAEALEFHYADFTEAGYRRLLEIARRHYRFVPFGEQPPEPHVYWRHDIDLSVHRALRLAELEAEAGIQGTYLVLLHSEYYNALEKSVTERLQAIAALGHPIGLHFDVSFYPGIETQADLEAKLAFERDILQDLLNCPVNVFSFHDPGTNHSLQFDADRIAGMVNTYSRSIRNAYHYCSDSNGFWRHDRLFDLLEAAAHPRLQVLTHPEWWTPEPCSPRERVSRCIDGRARSIHRSYDESLAHYERENIGVAQGDASHA